MRERRVAEAAVPAARPKRDPLGFEEDDRAARIRLEGLDRRPETGEPAADDGEVAFDDAPDRLARGRTVRGG
jgi:hypothetical protein